MIKHIEINIGKACNNKCRFCMSANVGLDEKALTNFSLIKAEILKYATNGYKSIGFLGGDISIHPNVYDIILEAKINGFKDIHIITNGMLFSDFNNAKKLIESGVTRVNISIHSHNNKIEDYITQISGGLNKKLKAIDNFNLLKDKGFLRDNLSINIVLNGLNYKDILKTCIYFNKIKIINDIRINFLWNRFFTTQEDRKKMEISYSEILLNLKEIIAYTNCSNLRLTFDSIPYCILSKLGIKNFEKYVGENLDHISEVSNLNKNIVFDWKKQKENELKIKFDKCNKCIYFFKCQGVWREYLDKYGCNEFVVVK